MLSYTIPVYDVCSYRNRSVRCKIIFSSKLEARGAKIYDISRLAIKVKIKFEKYFKRLYSFAKTNFSEIFSYAKKVEGCLKLDFYSHLSPIIFIYLYYLLKSTKHLQKMSHTSMGARQNANL